MKYFSRDETEFGAFGDQPSRFGASAAQTADFFDGGSLAPVAVAAPLQTAAQIAKAAAGRTAFQANVVTTAARTTANTNAKAYVGDRAATDRATIASNNLFAKNPINLKGTGAWNFADQDYGLLPAAAKIIVPLVATAATGGLAAPSLGAALKSVNDAKASITSGDIKASVKAIEAGDKLIASVQKGVDSAKKIVADTKAAAAAGVPDAVKGLNVLATVDAARTATGTPAGAALPPAAVDRLAIVAQVPIARPAAAAVKPKEVKPAPLAAGVTASDYARAALLKFGGPTDPKYLVLDSGQVLANELAWQPLAGWVVRFNGSVTRNG